MNMQLNLFASHRGDENLLESVTPPKKPVTQSDLNLAQRFREMADAMQVSIDQRLNPSILSGDLTARKLRVGQAIEREGEQLEEVQQCLRLVAAGLENGSLPLILTQIKTRTLVEQIYKGHTYPQDRLMAAGLTPERFQLARNALLEMLKANPVVITPERQKQRQLRRLQQWAAVSNIPGYFPTPPDVINLMVEKLKLAPGMKVLEPSAGSGHIADALSKLGCEVDCVEIQPDLAQLLGLKGFKVYSQDFLTFRRTYSRIAMNPDFKRNGDAIHIRHAYDRCLSEGGILVAIASSGIFDRSGRVESDFRDWFYSVGGTAKSLPNDAFKKGDRPTGVSTKLLTLRKCDG
ncbi:MAG: rRNA adenine N-6-methyltransferase family protein [Nostoc sp.]